MFEVPLQYVYLLALTPLAFIWILLFARRKDLHKEMLSMSVLLAIGSVVTSHFWWTIDWWQPPTITGTRAGIEDVLLGFFVGGIMAVAYEEFFRRRYQTKRLHHHVRDGLFLILLLSNLIAWGVYIFHITTFWASTIALIVTSIVLFSFRKDLIVNGLVSGALSVLIFTIPYVMIILLNSEWITVTYLSGLSGFNIVNIPVEEFIFWFLAGTFFGPFYEYYQGIKLRG